MEDARDERINLNASDDDDEDISYDDFRIRPQFQGPHGQELLELNTKLPERFKLDERFAEFFGAEDVQESEVKDDLNEERDKNLRILQSVLGHEVSKTTEKTKYHKKQVRFDPDDENTSHLVKSQETEQTKKSKKKKKEVKEDVPIPISTERYVEVCPDLKQVLNTASPFSFSKQFGHSEEEIEITDEIQNTYQKPKKYSDEKEDTFKSSFQQKEKRNFRRDSNNRSFSDNPTLPKLPKGIFKFFVEDGDPRLKEGVEFFKRPKPLNEIREEWSKKRTIVLDHFRKKKKSSQRSHTTRVRTAQHKFAMKRQHFKG